MVNINWKPNHAELRKFGVTLLIGFGLIGGLVFWRGHHAAAQWMWAIAGAIGVLAVALPPVSRPFYFAWMGVAFVMGTIVSTIMLAVIFFLVFAPAGLIMRLAGRDSLRLKRPSGTMWVDHPPLDDKSYYERLF